jgi:hypothetical protein
MADGSLLVMGWRSAGLVTIFHLKNTQNSLMELGAIPINAGRIYRLNLLNPASPGKAQGSPIESYTGALLLGISHGRRVVAGR